MIDNTVVVEKEITANISVVMTTVYIAAQATEVIVMTAASLAVPPGVGGAAWVTVGAGPLTPVAGTNYEIDTRAGAASVMLPPTPADGDMFGIRDGYAAFASNFCNIIPAVGSGHQIVQTAVVEETLSLNYPHVGNGFFFRFRAVDNTWSW